MSCIHSNKKKQKTANGLSTLEILDRFEDEHEILLKLAFVVTGDIGAAERSISEARDLVINGEHPVPLCEQFTEWLKTMTIKAAITNSLHEIARCESKYVNQNCTHSEHLLNGNDSKLTELRNFLLDIDPEIVIAELDPLARAVAILRTTARASILDCILRLKLSLTLCLLPIAER